MQQECDQAESQFQELAEDFPDWAAPLTGRGDAEFCAGDVNKALTHFRDAIENDPYNVEAQSRTGIWVLHTGTAGKMPVKPTWKRCGSAPLQHWFMVHWETGT